MNASKQRKRPHWLDILVIVVIVVLCAGAYYKFKVSDKTATSGEMTPVTYTVLINKVRGYAKDNVRKGDLLYDKTSGNCIGTITDVSLTPAKEALGLLNGTAVMAEVENRYDVLITVEADAEKNGNSYFVNRKYELVANSLKKFATKYFEAEGRVQDVRTR